MKKLIVMVVGCFLSCVVVATPSAGWTEKTKIVGVFEIDENRMLVRFDSYNNLSECSVDGGHLPDAGHVIFDPTTEKAKLSLLLAAFAAGIEVKAYVSSSCTPIWSGSSYGELGHVRLYK